MNELDLLRTIDPADDARDDDRAAAQLLRAVLAEPPPARRRRVRRRHALIALPVAAALLVALPFALNRGGESLAAKAYAQTAPGDEIVHEVSVSQMLEPPGPQVTQESWWRPADGTARRVLQTAGGKPIETVIGADGVAHLHSPYATHPDEVINPNGNADAPMMRRVLNRVRGVTLAFRDDYAGQQLRDEGITTLDGRTVHAYSADTKEWSMEDKAFATFHRTFYLDPDTARPIAQRIQMGKAIELMTVKRYEKLPVTPENLALLR
jgi:hypothetical protein